jgi:hypothetical protein
MDIRAAIHRFETLLKDVTFMEGWRIRVFAEDHKFFCQWTFYARDSKTGATEKQHGRKWVLSPWATDSEVVGTAFYAALTAMEHEVREAFKFKDQPVFNPHYNVHTLARMLAEERNRDRYERAFDGSLIDVRPTPVMA